MMPSEREPAKRFELDERLAQHISDAVCVAINTTFSVSITPGEVVFGEGMVSLMGDVSGIIAMVQDRLEGTLTVCMPTEALRDILPRVLGHGIPVTRDMTSDAVGEITNLVFGQIKTELNQRGHVFRLGIPSVIQGKGHFVSQFHRGRYMLASFHIENHLIQVHVAIHGGACDPSCADAP